MAVADQAHMITPAEYLARERETEFKCEYINGRIHAMAGASRSHVRIGVNLVSIPWQPIARKTARGLHQDLRLAVPATGLYTYPDVVVACPPLQFDETQQDTLVNGEIGLRFTWSVTTTVTRGPYGTFAWS